MNILRKSYLSAFMGAMFAIFSVVQAEGWSIEKACIEYLKYRGNIGGQYTNTNEKAVDVFQDIVHQHGGVPQELIKEAVIYAEITGHDVVTDSPKKQKKQIVKQKKVKADDVTKGALFLGALKLLGTGFSKMCKSSLPGFADAGTFLVKGTGSAFDFISKHKTASTVVVGVGAYLLYCWWMKSPVICRSWNGAFENEQKPVRTTRTVVYNQ